MLRGKNVRGNRTLQHVQTISEPEIKEDRLSSCDTGESPFAFAACSHPSRALTALEWTESVWSQIGF
jgi:hypothetical protein